MKRYTYIVLRMGCAEENEYYEMFDSKKKAEFEYLNLNAQNVIGKTKLIRFDSKTLEEKVPSNYTVDAELLAILNS